MKKNIFDGLIKIIHSFFSRKNDSIKMITDKKEDEKAISEDKQYINNENIESINLENNKKQFFQLYQESKKEDFDIYTLDKSSLAKICDIMEEELKIKQKILEEKKLALKKISE